MKCQNTILDNISIKLLGLDFMTEVYLHIQILIKQTHPHQQQTRHRSHQERLLHRLTYLISIKIRW